ncbi:glycosyl hydrolase [Krasilnikovia sp. MM14-A1004]|uniref:glycosyl hydrolase n=1 Tax=Krasilnikovia sp. MM14-A1004 TaxID=3373541 RepID=UPI00399C593A
MTPQGIRAGLAGATAALVLTGVGLTAAVLPARAAPTAGYTTDRVGPLPTGCGDLSTRPRQFVTPHAPAGALPTNDWWSSLVFKRTECAYSEPLHAHPISFDTYGSGLGFSGNDTAAISGTATGVGEFHYPYVQDIRVGVAGLAAPVVTVDDWSDWTVTPYWSDGSHTLRATIGKGLPFAYFQATGGNAVVTATGTPAVFLNDGATIGFTANGHDYAAYAPTGASWTVSGSTLTSGLAGHDYFSVALLPPSTDNAGRTALARQFGQYAHNHVTGTRVDYQYAPATGAVTTTYSLTTRAREGNATGTVIGLYPHQWKNLTGATPLAPTYRTARGTMKLLAGVTSYRTTMTFHGVLPELPAVGDGTGADLTALTRYLTADRADPQARQGEDTYWTGKGLGRAARIAEISDLVGDTETRDRATAAIKASLTDWFTAPAGKTTHVFAYNGDWGALIGYPASYGSDSELNDHSFHYGYYVTAAATLARFDPAWARTAPYRDMVDMLIRDANNYDRSDTRFPFLRDFDIYEGHDWASGHGSFGAGNDEESSSEGMNFASAMILWGQATGNTAIRDAGVFLYTTQAAAVDEYWFDVDGDNFPASFAHSGVGMVWGDGGAYSTWFSAEPEMINGINRLPITAGHLYLGDHPAYVRSAYAEMVRNNGGEPSVWQDVLWSYQALGDGAAALANLRANPGYTVEEGESRGHTFHWIRNLAVLGTVDTAVHADYPLAAVFTADGARTYVAANTGDQAITVTFSDGRVLSVPPGRTVAAGAHSWSGGNGAAQPSSDPSETPTESPSPTPTGTTPTDPTPTSPTPSDPTPSTPASPTLYLVSGALAGTSGQLSGAAGARGTATVAAAAGNHDGTPAAALAYRATGVDLAYQGGTTAFDLFLDAGTAVGNGVQVRISYDLTGDGTVDRSETYRYFATDPIAGYEHYTQAAGLLSATGTAGDLHNGTVTVEVWSAIGSQPTTLGLGDQSRLVLPYE